MSASTQRLPLLGFALLGCLGLFWGMNWPAMKLAVSEIPIWWFRSICLTVGGVGLLTITKLAGQRILLPRHQIIPVCYCALFSILGWHVFSAYGVSNMPAGRASIIGFTMPIWAAVLASLVLKERFTKPKTIGLILGFISLVALMGKDIIVVQEAPIGAFFMLCASLVWATGTVLFKREQWDIPVSVNIGWQLGLSSIPVTIIALLTTPFPDVSAMQPSTLWGMAYVLAFPILFCQWAYFKVVALFPASIAAIGTLMVPVVGVYSSHLLLGEAVGIQELIALVCVSMALFIVMILPQLNLKR